VASRVDNGAVTTSGTDLMFIESTMPAFDVMIAGASAAGTFGR
jgi:hypothetical protein